MFMFHTIYLKHHSSPCAYKEGHHGHHGHKGNTPLPPLPPRTLQGVTTLRVSESAVPNNGKVGNQVLCPHSRCFRAYFAVIFLMYLVSSGFSLKPTSSSSIILIDPV